MENRYSPRQLSQHLGVHVTTIWRWLTKGVAGRVLASRLYGGRRYVLGVDLQEFLNNGAKQAEMAKLPPDD